MLPIVATLLAQGLGLLGNAVIAKGKEAIEEKLGIDIEAATQTPEGLFKLRQLETDHEEFLLTTAVKNRELDLQDKTLDISNTNSARDSNTKIQESANASELAKNAAYILDFMIVAGTLILAYAIFFAKIPEGNKEIAFAAFGSLITLCGTVVNFHRGSSGNSKAKDETIATMMRGVQ